MAFDLNKLIRPGVIPAVAERFRVKGKKTNCTNGEVTYVRCVMEIQPSAWNGGQILQIVEGGVTGYESICLGNREMADLGTHGWCACAGTKGRWDTLEIDQENMAALAVWVKEKLASLP